MHISTTRRHYVTADGTERDYETHLLRRSVRVGKTVRNETLANLSHLPPELIEALRAGLAGKQLVVAGEGLELKRALPHGHVAALSVQAQLLGLPGLLGPACKERDIAYGLILARALRPASKRATLSWWTDTTLAEDLGLAGVGTDEAYQAMDWLLASQESIEAKLAKRHLQVAANPSRRAYFDLSSSWMEGTSCPLVAFGHSRDAKRGKPQIEYGLLTDPTGCPVAIRVFAGNTADPSAFSEIVTVVRERFGLDHLTMVGDRGMITKARIYQLRGLPGMGWLTALRAPAIKALAQDDGPLQMAARWDCFMAADSTPALHRSRDRGLLGGDGVPRPSAHHRPQRRACARAPGEQCRPRAGARRAPPRPNACLGRSGLSACGIRTSKTRPSGSREPRCSRKTRHCRLPGAAPPSPPRPCISGSASRWSPTD